MVPLHGHQLVIRHGDDSALTDEHGDACHGDGDLDGLAALILAQVVAHIVPLAAGGQVDGAGGCTLFHNVCHQDALAEHERQVLVGVALGIVRELQEQRAPCRHTVLVALVHQGVQGGHQAVTQLVSLADVGQVLLIHPGLGNGVVVVGGVQAEAGLEHAVLQPAEQGRQSRRCRSPYWSSRTDPCPEWWQC